MPTPANLRSLIERCANGEPEAQVAFQEQYGWLIYTLPTQLFRLPAVEAGDFYLYVFERERIFKRVRSFQGRNAMQFETYLSYYVLKDLFLDWVRTRERVETMSLDAPMQHPVVSQERARTGYDILAVDTRPPDTVVIESDEVDNITRVFDQLDDEKRLSLKLLALWTIELTPDDLRCLAVRPLNASSPLPETHRGRAGGMNCVDTETLAMYLKNELDSQHYHTVTAHLCMCQHCAQRLSAFQHHDVLLNYALYRGQDAPALAGCACYHPEDISAYVTGHLPIQETARA